MNDGTIIIEKILADANKEAEMIINDAKIKASEINVKSVESINELNKKAEAEADAEAEKVKSKEISSAKMEAGKKILAKKQELINSVLAEAYNRLMASDGEDYVNTIINMLKSAPDGEVILSEKDKALFGEKIKEKGFVLADETRDIEKGFVIKNGDIEHNFSFASILSVEEEEIRYMIADILFK